MVTLISEGSSMMIGVYSYISFFFFFMIHFWVGF